MGNQRSFIMLKKEDNQLCNNYRNDALLNITFKVLSNFLLDKISGAQAGYLKLSNKTTWALEEEKVVDSNVV